MNAPWVLERSNDCCESTADNQDTRSRSGKTGNIHQHNRYGLVSQCCSSLLKKNFKYENTLRVCESGGRRCPFMDTSYGDGPWNRTDNKHNKYHCNGRTINIGSTRAAELHLWLCQSQRQQRALTAERNISSSSAMFFVFTGTSWRQEARRQDNPLSVQGIGSSNEAQRCHDPPATVSSPKPSQPQPKQAFSSAFSQLLPLTEMKMKGKKLQILWPKSSESKSKWETTHTDLFLLLEQKGPV